ncbi:MAG: response regulator [Polyangiaceae bacterium]|nr:response regulator [Polyangiaceae bacterium]
MALPAEWTKKEVNTRAFRSGVLYVKRTVGQAALENLCAEIGLSYEYVADENNWVSMAWLNRFYEKMVQVTGNPKAPYESGLLAADPEAWGAIYFLFRAVGSPGLAYRVAAETVADFNKNARVEYTAIGRSEAILKWYAADEHRYVCDNRRGQMVATPLFWDLPPAEVVEEECCARGGACCHYRITWIKRSTTVPALAVAMAAALGAWAISGALGADPRWLLAALCALGGFLATRVWALQRDARDFARFSSLQNAKLKSSMQDLERKYDEVRKASAEIEDLNVNLEQKVEQRTSELHHAQAELETSYKKLQELDRIKSQFFSNITHELRTPLTMILAPLEGLLEGEIGNLRLRQKEYLRPIQRNALKLLKLINDLLDLAKVEENYLRLRVEPTDLVGLVTEIVEQARPLAARKGITLGFEVRRAEADLEVDLEKMERVLVNLVSNALKFTDAGGRVDLWIDANEAEARIGVCDTGVGIPADQLERVFERFSQADASTTRRFGGTGIGLTLAKEIVQLHGGRITVQSEEGRGSEFIVHLRRGAAHLRPEILDRRQSSLPAAAARRGEDREPREWTRLLVERTDYRFLELEQVTERRAAARGETGPRVSRVLVVEDNTDVLEFVSLQLREEHEVYLAQDGKKGFELASRELPDVIVTDYMMPEMDGLSLVRALRADARTQRIPVIMLTAKAEVQDRIDAREAGAEIYLNKPFSPRELRSAVARLLEQRGQQLSYTVREQVKSLELISAGLAHEIHNPLNYIRTALFVIREATARVHKAASEPHGDATLQGIALASQHKIEHMYQIAGKGIERINRIVELVRKYAREGYPSEPTPTCLDTMIRDMAPLLSPLNDNEIHVELELGSGGAEVRCIPDEMQRALTSLWQNALDAVGPGGHVTIRTRVDGGSLVLEVLDDGPGIPRDQVGRIFVPFYTTKAPGQGLGLGLAIAYQVVSQAGGALTVESVEHHGSTFRVRLPLASPPPSRAATAPDASPFGSASG